MYKILIIMLLLTGQAYTQTKVYDLKTTGIDGNTISLSNYAGKKIVVGIFSFNSMNAGNWKFLDSLQAKRKGISVIIVPVVDLDSSIGISMTSSFNSVSGNAVVVTSPAKVGKDRGSEQIPILQWLTRVSGNSHFDIENITDGQLYFINESGILYAVLENGAPIELINTLLMQADFRM